VQGREWERFAWLKSRVVAPRAVLAGGPVQALRAWCCPSCSAVPGLQRVRRAAQLHRQIRDHASKRSAGRPARANDVKLSRGGIREIEFIVQLLQVVRGGQYPSCARGPRWARWNAWPAPA
jgi:glutamate-ammonia-ligase adenylyltransferase